MAIGDVPKTKAEVKAQATKVKGSPTPTGLKALTAIATADATDLASAQALANACKAKINQIIVALKA